MSAVDQPDVATQQHLARLFKQLDYDGTAAALRLAKTRQFKQGRMQTLLTDRSHLI